MGVFSFLVDDGESAQVTFIGPPRACLLAEFIVEMICEENYSIMESLVENGF